MKKLISVILALIMMFTVVTPAFAFDYVLKGSDIPVVAIFGDGEPIYNTEGEKIFHFKEILNMLGGSEEGAAGEAVQNVLKPFLIEGILFDKWDNYYAALEKEIGDIFAESRYDENGENPNGSDVSPQVRQYMKMISALMQRRSTALIFLMTISSGMTGDRTRSRLPTNSMNISRVLKKLQAVPRFQLLQDVSAQQLFLPILQNTAMTIFMASALTAALPTELKS